jgi:hypothetical protein
MAAGISLGRGGGASVCSEEAWAVQEVGWRGCRGVRGPGHSCMGEGVAARGAAAGAGQGVEEHCILAMGGGAGLRGHAAVIPGSA